MHSDERQRRRSLFLAVAKNNGLSKRFANDLLSWKFVRSRIRRDRRKLDDVDVDVVVP